MIYHKQRRHEQSTICDKKLKKVWKTYWQNSRDDISYKTLLRKLLQHEMQIKNFKKVWKKCWQIKRNDVRYKTSLRYATKYLEN